MARIKRHRELNKRFRQRTNQRSRIRQRRTPLFQAGLGFQELEARLVLTGISFPGNECQPDLDLSGIPPQTLVVGEPWTLDLLADGATASDLNADDSPTGDAFHFQLDPDVGIDVPDGVVLIDASGNTVLTNDTGLLRWTPTSNQLGEHTIMIIMMDDGNPVLADSERLTVTVVTEINTPAVVDLNGDAPGDGFDTIFTADLVSVSIVGTVAPNALTITDAQNSDIAFATAILVNPSDGAAETLSVDTTGTGLTANYEPSTGILQISGTASPSIYQDVMRTLMYANSATTPTVGLRTVDITVNDGTDSTPVTSTIDVQAVVQPNQVPNIDAIGDETIVIGDTIEITVTATDPNAGDTLTFQLDPDNRPDGATIEATSNNTAIVRWTPTSTDGPGPHTVRVIVTDDGTPALSDAEEFLVTVQFPTEVDLNGPASGTEFEATFAIGGSPVAIVDATQLSVTDLDSSTISTVTATLQSALNGTNEILAVDTSGTGISANYDTTSRVLTLTGDNSSPADFEQVLRTLTYNNTAFAPTAGVRTVEVLPTDGNLPTIAAISTVNVVDTNTAPTITAIPDQTANVGQEIIVDVFASDADGDTLTFSLDPLSPGAEISLTSATTAQIRWTPSAQGPFDFRVVVTDDGTPVKMATEDFVVNVIATAPAVDLNGVTSASFTEDSVPTALLTTAPTITDPDSTELVSATVTITNLADGDAEVLAVSIDGTNVGAQYNNGVLALAGSASLATYESILASLTYVNTSDNPTTTPRVVEIQVSDGASLSSPVAVNVTIVAINDAPIIDPVIDVQGEATVPLSVNVSAVDPEGGAVSFSLDTPPEGVTLLDNDDGTAIISWTPPSDGTFLITFEASDDSDPAALATLSFNVIVAAFNSPPTVDLNGDGEGINTTIDFVEDGGPVLLSADIVVGDDGDELTSATARITNVLDGDDETLAVTIPAGSNVTFDYTDGVLSLNGTDTPAAYQTILETLTYDNASQDSDTTDRVIEVTVNDGAKNSAVATAEVNLTAVNDAPVFAAVPDQFVEVNTLFTVQIIVTDVDNDMLTIGLNTDVSPAGAELIIPDGTTEGTLSWTPDTVGEFTFNIAAADIHDDSTTPEISILEFIVTVHSPNTPPVVDLNGDATEGNDTTADFVENGGPIALVTSDLVLADNEDLNLQSATVAITNPLDDVAEILSVTNDGTGVTSDFTAGVLTLNGLATLATYESILESLTYNNVSENPASTDRLIEVTVSDGIDNSATATITLTVTPVNDAPVATEVAAQQAILGEELVVPLTATDPDSVTLSFTLDDATLPGAEIVNADGVNSFHWTPGVEVTPGAYTATITVSDDADPAATDVLEFDITVVDRPLLDLNGVGEGTGFTGSWTFGGPDVPILFPNRVATMGITDLDSSMMTGATVTIVNPLDGADEVLAAAIPNDLTTTIVVSYDAGTNVLSLTGTDSVANYQSVLANVTYDHLADAPTFGSRTIHVSVVDDTAGAPLSSNIAVSMIIVQSIPDGSDTIATADSLTIPTGDTIVQTGLIENGGDVDLFSIEAVDGETLFLSASESILDTYLRLFDAAGNELVGGATPSWFDVTEDGIYYLGVSAADLTDYDPNVVAGRSATLIGSYELVVSRFETGSGNNTIPLATPVTVTAATPTPVIDSLVSSSDIDLFAIDVTASQRLQVEVTARDFDVVIRIFDELGNDIGIDDGTPNLLFVEPNADGTVFVGISSVDLGNYHPNNPDGRAGGTPTGYELELTLSDVDPTPADIDEVMAQVFGHDTYVP